MGPRGGARLLSKGHETLPLWSQVIIVVDVAMEVDLRRELAAACLPTHLTISIYPMAPEKTSACPSKEEIILQRADHLSADAVFFIGRTLSDASQWYIQWVRYCHSRVAVGQLRPAAHVHCVTRQASIEEFKDACSQQPGADVVESDQLHVRTFRHLAACTGTSIAPITDIREVAGTASEIRKSLNAAWSKSQAHAIREAYMEHLRAGKHTIFKVNPASSWSRFRRDKRSSVVQALFASNKHRLDDPEFSQVLTSYICASEDTLATLRGSVRRDSQPGPQRTEANGKRVPRLLRRKLQAMLPPIDSLAGAMHRNLVSRLLRGVLCWEQAIKGPTRTRVSAQDRHIGNLMKHSGFLRRQEYGAICLVCLGRPWQLLLQCGHHGACYQCRKSIRKSHGRMCFVCDSLEHSLRPNLSQECGRGRVLALDGGGVRGHIQLEVLALLEREIGLDLPLRSFFDLIVGTSIGGIVALGLGVKQWSIAECQTKLTDLSRKIFKKRSKVTSGLARATRGWSETIVKVARLYWYDSIYDWRLLESVLRDAFGADDLLAGAGIDAVKVAVTATTGSTPPCTIFTNYDKSRHSKERAYDWPDESVASKIKIWEAARCTSAAPVYFSTKHLFGEAFYDGGMFHNNPDHLSRHEASVLFNCHAEENLVISVGCGDLSVAPGGSSSLSRLWDAFAHKLRPAKEEEIRALWGADRRNYERLDPKLDMPEIALDNLQAMLDAMPHIRDLLSQSKVLQEAIRRTAWKLVATTFYAIKIDIERAGGRTQIKLRISCRLKEETWRIWRKWPDAHLTIDGRPLRQDKQDGRFSVQTSCVPVGHNVDVRLNAYGRSASISGFPMPVVVTPEHRAVSSRSHVLGKRKRN